MSQTENKFKRTSVAGQFKNIDLPNGNGSDLANAYFQRNIQVDGDIHIGKETLADTVYTNTGGNFCFKINGVDYSITPTMLTYLISLTDNLALKSDISYVDNKVAQLVDSSPATLDTLLELATALGNDPNFATTVSTNIGLKADKIYTDNQLFLKTDKTYTDTQLLLKAPIANPTFTGTITNTALTTSLNSKMNKAGDSISGYLHYANHASPYTEYQTNLFGSISSNRAGGGGHAELDFIQNNFAAGSNNRAFSFLLATSNTTFSELVIIFKGGNMNVLGNVSTPTLNATTSIVSPTITTINTNITNLTTNLALKDDITSVNTKLALKDDITSVDSKILNLQNQINTIDTSGTNNNSSLTTLINTKSDLTYVNDQLALKDSITSVNTKLALKDDITSVDTKLALKDDITSVNTKIALKSNLASPTFTGTVTTPNLTVTGTITNTALTNLIDTKSNIASPTFIGTVTTPNLTVTGSITNTALTNLIATKQNIINTTNRLAINALGDGTITNEQFNFLSGLTSNAQSQLNTLTTLVITKQNVINPSNRLAISLLSTGLITDTEFNYLSGLTSNAQTQLNTKANLSLVSNVNNTSDINKPVSTAQQTALNGKLNKAGDAMGSYLHFDNHGQPYTEYQTGRFGSISVNRVGGGGHGEMDFINNNFVSSSNTRAFSFLLATSNTTFTELLRLFKNGSMVVMGNVTTPTLNATSSITSPTITTINNTLALKDDITSVNTKLALKADLSYTNTQLALKAPINNPTFTGVVNAPSIISSTINSDTGTNLTLNTATINPVGIVSANSFKGNLLRTTTNVNVVYTASTLPTTIFKNNYSDAYSFGIPDMPIGTKFTVLKTSDICKVYSTAADVYFYTSYLSWNVNLTIEEDSRTFVRADFFDYLNNVSVKAWLTESSYMYNQHKKLISSLIGAYMLDGGNSGLNSENYRPIICSTRYFYNGDSDDGYILNDGFKLLLYPDTNYGGGAITLNNYNVNVDTAPKPMYFASPMTNNMQSCKLYYRNVEVVVTNIS